MSRTYWSGLRRVLAIGPLMALFAGSTVGDAFYPIEEYRPLLEKTTCTGECNLTFRNRAFRVTRVQLDEKGTPSFLISPTDMSCGKQGCDGLFMKRGGAWERIFEFAGVIEVAATRSNGMADLVVRYDDHSTGLRRNAEEKYTWDGKAYRQVKARKR